MISKKANVPSNSVTVVGVGRVGLPFALWLAKLGYQVYGLDVNPKTIESLKKGVPHFSEAGLDQLLKENIGDKFIATHDPRCVGQSEFVILTIGTPVDEHLNPVYSQIDSAIEQLSPYLKSGQGIFLRSTVAPGTTARFASNLERRTELVIGKDLFVAYCPERIAEGKALLEIPTIPQIVGGVDTASTVCAYKFFETVSAKVLATDSTSAELSKLFCNMFRYINFAISNEFMMLAQRHERNIFEIINLVNEDYPRGGLPKPGFAAGPCLFKDGFFLNDGLPFADLISTSWRINESLPGYLVSQIKNQTSLVGKTVAVLGLSFKKNIDDNRNSLSYKLKRYLVSERAEVLVHDPYFAKGSIKQVCQSADVVILAVNHDQYTELGKRKFYSYLKPGALLCDLWNVFKENRLLFQPNQIEPNLSPIPEPQTVA